MFYSPDFFGSDDEATYVQGDLAYKSADNLTPPGALGRQWVLSDFDHTTWNVSVAYVFNDSVALDMRCHDTDEHDVSPICGSRVVASLKATFKEIR